MEKGLKIEQIAKICSELVARRDPEETLEYVEDNLKQIPEISLHKIPGNLIAELNKDAEQTLIFCGHLDVFPPRNMGEWKYDPFSGKMIEYDKDVVIFGCGASDMKGGITVLLTVLSVLAQKVPPVHILMMFTTDEESGGYNGTRKLLDTIPPAIGCFIPEPTGLKHFSLGEKGELMAIISNEEKNRIKEGVERIAKRSTLTLYSGLKDIFERSENFFTSFGFEEKINAFYASREERIDNNRTYIQIEIPYLIDYFRVLDFVNLLAGSNIIVQDYVPPTLTSPASFIVKTIMKSSYKIMGKSALPLFFPCSSEAPFFRQMGIPTVLYGPGETVLPHNKNEFVKASSILKCSQIYLEAVDALSELCNIQT